MSTRVDIIIRSFERDWLDIFWDVIGHYDPMQYEFRVLRSEGPAGPFEPMTGYMLNRNHLRDNVITLIHKIRHLYYVVDMRNRQTSAVQRFGPVTLSADPDLVGMELIRQTRMEIRFGSGRIAWLFPVRTMGMRCRACYDSISGIRFRSQCVDCLDSGFAGGYWAPIESEMDISESDEEETHTDNDKIAQVNTTARMSNFPPAKPGDLIVTAENERYKVEKVTAGEHRRAAYEQDLLLHAIPRGDIEYRIPLPIVDLKNFNPNPDPRIETLPTDSETLSDDAIIEMFEQFGGVRL